MRADGCPVSSLVLWLMMRCIKNSCEGFAPVIVPADCCWADWPRLNTGCLRSRTIGRTQYFAAGNFFSVVTSQSFQALQAGTVLNLSSSAFIGCVIWFLSVVVHAVGAFATFSRLASLIVLFFRWMKTFFFLQICDKVGAFRRGWKLMYCSFSSWHSTSR